VTRDTRTASTLPTDPDALLDTLDGLVPLHLMRFRTQPLELARAYEESGNLADTISESGDRLTNASTFRSATDRVLRGDVLNAMATALALGALNEGGVTWAGRHWCTEAHADCPNGSTQ
jgi:hypothetical protein